MNIPLIVKELKKQLPKGTRVHEGKGECPYFCFFAGENFYLHVMEFSNGSKEIKIHEWTENPEIYVDMIKKIDTNAVVDYYETVKIESRV